MLKRDLTVRLDGRSLQLTLTGSEFAEPEELRTGSGIIQVEFSVEFHPVAGGAHRLTLENRHLREMRVYLINAARPKLNTIQITEQKRNQNQSAGEITFIFHPSAASVTDQDRP